MRFLRTVSVFVVASIVGLGMAPASATEVERSAYDPSDNIVQYMKERSEAAYAYAVEARQNGSMVTFENMWGVTIDDYLSALEQAGVAASAQPMQADDGRYFAMCGAGAARTFNPNSCPGGQYFQIFDRQQGAAVVWEVYRSDINNLLGNMLPGTWAALNNWCSSNPILCNAVWSLAGGAGAGALRWWRAAFL